MEEASLYKIIFFLLSVLVITTIIGEFSRLELNKEGFGLGDFGDNVNVASGKAYKVNSVQVVGAQGASVADATDAASAITQLNSLLSRLRTHGLIAT